MKEELMEKTHSIVFRATKAECLDLSKMTERVKLKIYKGLIIGNKNKTTTSVLIKKGII